MFFLFIFTFTWDLARKSESDEAPWGITNDLGRHRSSKVKTDGTS